MAAAKDLLIEMKALATQLDEFPAKIEDPQLRPSYRQSAQLQQLATNISQFAQNLLNTLAPYATIFWAQEFKGKSIGHIAQAESLMQTAREGQPNIVILKRNLVLIFHGPSISITDSEGVIKRKERTRLRCHKLRDLDSAVIVAWGLSVQPSAWEMMSQDVFDYLLDEMKKVVPDDVLPNILGTIRALGSEEPLSGILLYHEFLQGDSRCEGRWKGEEAKNRAGIESLMTERTLAVTLSATDQPASHQMLYGGETFGNVDTVSGPVPVIENGPEQSEGIYVPNNGDYNSAVTRLNFDVPDAKLFDLLAFRPKMVDGGVQFMVLSVPLDLSDATISATVPCGDAFRYATVENLEFSSSIRSTV
ncbi:MAG: hypothetical protein Q9163_002828 [Psora crenata]